MDLFDVEAIEVAEAQLDKFIERRAREARDAERLFGTLGPRSPEDRGA